MPRIIDYPRGAFFQALQIADVVGTAGGTASVAECADFLGKKVSGAFKALVSAAIKHGLVVNRKEVLTTTALYQRCRSAESEEARWQCLKQAFLLPALYHRVFGHFRGKPLPAFGLDELLVREFGADADYASRLAGYFTEGVRMLYLLRDGLLTDEIPAVRPLLQELPEAPRPRTPAAPQARPERPTLPITPDEPAALPAVGRRLEAGPVSPPFSLTIDGPGIQATLEIAAEEDLRMAEAILSTLRNKMSR